MSEIIMSNEPVIRLSCFVGFFLIIALWETLLPLRERSVQRRHRWPSNLAIVMLNTLLLRIVVPTAAVGLAMIAQSQQWGLLHQFTFPLWLAFLLGFVLLDLFIYVQHVMFHAIPGLWRLHRMHHADLDFDVTTGTRFHPLEILLSMGIKLMVVTAIGPPVAAVLVFEVVLNATSMFNHANAQLPPSIDKLLRWLIVTPDMHRVHHSVVAQETNSNFGFNLTWWDRIFGTYRAQPAAGHQAMVVGIEQFRSPQELRLDRMLSQPFREHADIYPINK